MTRKMDFALSIELKNVLVAKVSRNTWAATFVIEIVHYNYEYLSHYILANVVVLFNEFGRRSNSLNYLEKPSNAKEQ